MGGPAKKVTTLITGQAKKSKLENYANSQGIDKSMEQPKVPSQMDNSDVKSKAIIADKLANNRKGRRRTIMTSVTGVDEYATLSKKSLLGG